jgi:probable HAF family extracellular repeat protein
MATPSDPREVPPPLPRDPRDRLPAILSAMLFDPAQTRLWAAKVRSFLYRWLMRFGRACARGWRAIDGTGRLFLVCAIGLVILTAVLPTVALWGLATAGLLIFASRIRRWRDLDRRGRLLVVCGSAASVVALVLAVGGSSHKSGDETRMPNTTSTASDKRAAPQSTTSSVAPRFRYNVTDLGTLGGDTSRANGINNHGQVVGEARTSDGTTHPFLWDSTNGMQDLGGLGGVEDLGQYGRKAGSATGINDAGQVVGAAYTRARDKEHAFLWEAGRRMQDLGTLGGETSEALSINKKGQVAGRSRTALGNNHAFLWDARRGMQDLGTLGGKTSEAHGINDSGQVVGSSGIGENGLDDHAFLWEAGTGMKDLGTLGGASSCAYGINNSGVVVGTADTSKGSHAAFVWNAGREMRDLGTLRPTDNWVWVSGISNAGVVIGESDRQLDTWELKRTGAFFFEHGRMSGFDGLIDPGSCRGFFPEAVNDRGQIAGNGATPAGQCHAFLLTPVPENTVPPDTATPKRSPNSLSQSATGGRTEPLTASDKPEVPPGDGKTPRPRRPFRYAVTDLGTFGEDTSRANGINNHGQVVGEARTSGGFEQPFVWNSTHGMQDLGGLGRGTGSAMAINDAGQVVGKSYTEPKEMFAGEHAFLWEAGRGMRDLGTIGGGESKAFGINKKGQVVGSSDIKSDAVANTHAFLWDARRGMQDLGTLGDESQDSEARCIDDSGRVVGLAWVGGLPLFSHAYLWEEGNAKGLGTLGSWGIATGEAHCINNSGQVVGTTSVPGGYHAFLWDARRGMQDLGTLEERWSDALAVNNKAEVVGLVKTADIHSDAADAAVLFAGSEVIDLNDMIDPASGWHLVEATAINDIGQIVGQGRNSVGQLHAFLLTPVPSGRVTATGNPSQQSTGETPAKPKTTAKPRVPSNGDESATARYKAWIKEQAKTFQPNGLTEVERAVGGKKVLYLYYRRAPAAVEMPVSELANYMQEEASRRDWIVQRKAIAEASGRYDEVIISEIAP